MENKSDSVENILSHLIQGIDPKTGIQIREGSLILQEPIKEALSSALNAVRAHRSEQVQKLNLPANTGKQWSKEDDQKLGLDFDLGLTVEQMARNFQRTRGSINARLMKLGKIEDDGSWGKHSGNS